MDKGRTIFIGDIHGCYDEFMLLLQKLNINQEDKIYITGDLTNKGPKSVKLLKYLLFNNIQFKSVLGNNEVYIIQYMNGKLPKDHINYKETHALCKRLQNKPELLGFIKNMPAIIEEKNFILVHAGLLNGDLKDQNIETLTGTDKKVKNDWFLDYKGTKLIIYGHNSSRGIRKFGNTLGIDSGCVFGGYLTAYILESGEIIQQKAFKRYEKTEYNIKKDIFTTNY